MKNIGADKETLHWKIKICNNTFCGHRISNYIK